jgi:hypothetical protein
VGVARCARIDGNATREPGWGKPLPKGQGQGVAVAYSFLTYVAAVVEVAVSDKGELAIPRVDMAVDCGAQIHPERVRAPAVWSRAQLARTLAERGVFDEGDAHGHEAVRIAEALDHPFSVVVGCLDLAYLKSVRGELSQAARLIERAVAQCREWSITSHTPIAMASLGHVYAWSGRIKEGVSLLQQALAAFESGGIGYCHSISVVQLAEVYLLADQLENARACADRAVMLARTRGERGS